MKQSSTTPSISQFSKPVRANQQGLSSNCSALLPPLNPSSMEADVLERSEDSTPHSTEGGCSPESEHSGHWPIAIKKGKLIAIGDPFAKAKQKLQRLWGMKPHRPLGPCTSAPRKPTNLRNPKFSKLGNSDSWSALYKNDATARIPEAVL